MTHPGGRAAGSAHSRDGVSLRTRGGRVSAWIRSCASRVVSYGFTEDGRPESPSPIHDPPVQEIGRHARRPSASPDSPRSRRRGNLAAGPVPSLERGAEAR